MVFSALPCYLLRANRLTSGMRINIQIPSDRFFQREIDEALGSKSHEETEAKLNRMSDEEFLELIMKLAKRRKSRRRPLEEETREEITCIA